MSAARRRAAISCPIRALVDGFANELRRARLFIMLQAYIDDSGDAGSTVAFMGGFLSSAEKWDAFSNEWQAVLDERPTLQYFKMSEAAACRGQFGGWSTQRRDERMARLVEIIRRYAQMAIISAINVLAFKALYRKRFEKGSDSLHFLLFYGVIHRMIYYQMQTNNVKSIDFIFDEQGKESLKALDAWEAYIKAAPSEALPFLGARPIHRNDRDALPLQAADMFAWVHHRRFHDRTACNIASCSPLADLDRIPLLKRLYTSADLIEIIDGTEHLKAKR